MKQKEQRWIRSVLINNMSYPELDIFIQICSLDNWSRPQSWPILLYALAWNFLMKNLKPNFLYKYIHVETFLMEIWFMIKNEPEWKYGCALEQVAQDSG